MGILRSDRVSGLGGANAINGSAFFPQNSYINVEADSDLDLSGDFTIEMWVRNLAGPDIAMYQRQIASKNYFQSGSDGNWYFGLNQFSTGELYFYSYDGQGSAESLSGNIATPDLDRWYHIAAARSGSTLKMFLDGSEEASGTVSKGLDDGGNNGLFIGGISKNKGTDSYGDHYGWISNLRIIKGRALYTADFTVPTGRLEKTSDTVLLCFQSPGDVLEEKTGKILSHNNHDTTGASKEVSAERLAPDVGEDYGTTFEDNTKFDTLSYMVPPGGTTSQRSRGLAVFGGGITPSITSMMDYCHIPTMGNLIRWGDLTASKNETSAFSSSTRGVWAGGTTGTYQNVIESMEFATQATPTDFGDLTVARGHSGGTSNSTRGLVFGGYDATPNPDTMYNTIDYVTIASAGNAQDFGDTTVTGWPAGGSRSSTTRAVTAGYATPSNTNTIDYVTIATTGDASNFGDLNHAGYGTGAGNVSNGTRAVFLGNSDGPSNTIDYITISTTGNATDFGDLTAARRGGGSASTLLRGILVGGRTPSEVNTIDYVTIATTGNGSDFGDATSQVSFNHAGCSDSHGGLS